MALQKINLVIPDDLKVDVLFPQNVILNDYNSLKNIPTFEGQPIKGNLTFQSTGIAPLESLDALTTVVNQKANTVDVQNACGQLQEQITTNKNDIDGLGDQTQEIESKIPSAASETNQLADKQFVQDLTSALNFVKWVDTLPETGESKYIYAVPREETDTEGKQIAALYLWDGSAWRGAGAFSLNIDPATLATKAELAGYLPLSGGTINGALKVAGPLSEINTFLGTETNGYTRLDLIAKDGNWAELRLYNNKGQTHFRQLDSGKTEIFNSLNKTTFLIGSTLTFNNNKVLDASDKAVANGVASLDENAKVPSEQIPVATTSALGGVKLEFDETTGTLNIKTE